jgi:4-hydroxybenzoate polyprenyltransferase
MDAERTRPDPVATVSALLVVNRLPTTVGYNASMVVLALGLGALAATGRPASATVLSAGLYAVGVMLLKMQASVADAIHDRDVDAENPEKSSVAAAVQTLGIERAWTVLAVELIAGMALVGVAARLAASWLLIAGATIALLGFTYSYPPRIKERGIWNHVVTTGVDAGLLLLAIAVIIAGRLSPTMVLVAGLVACYSFAYHVLHQAADVHHDRRSGVRTFAGWLGVRRSVALSAGLTAVAAGFSLALGYPLAAVGAGGVTIHYVRLYGSVVGTSTRLACEVLSRRFSIAWIATVLNGLLAAAVWRRALARPVVTAVATLL